MSAWADYVEWSGLDESALRHPAGKRLESVEVAEHRMDMEAVALANSGRRRSRVPDWACGILLGLFVYALITGLSLAALLAGGAQL